MQFPNAQSQESPDNLIEHQLKFWQFEETCNLHAAFKQYNLHLRWASKSTSLILKLHGCEPWKDENWIKLFPMSPCLVNRTVTGRAHAYTGTKNQTDCCWCIVRKLTGFSCQSSWLHSLFSISTLTETNPCLSYPFWLLWGDIEVKSGAGSHRSPPFFSVNVF